MKRSVGGLVHHMAHGPGVTLKMLFHPAQQPYTLGHSVIQHLILVQKPVLFGFFLVCPFDFPVDLVEFFPDGSKLVLIFSEIFLCPQKLFAAFLHPLAPLGKLPL